MADAYFINKPVAYVCRPEPDAEIDQGIVAEFQIASGIKLMRLLAHRRQILYRPKIALILKTQIQPPIQVISKARTARDQLVVAVDFQINNDSKPNSKAGRFL